jgi:predicted GIY-YIG superfamily endonuclease
MITLYALVDPRAPRWPRYIGITKNPDMRLRKHIKAHAVNAKLGQWKRKIREAGLQPAMLPLRVFSTRAEAEQAEWRLIQRLQRRGLADLNAQPLMMKSLAAMAESRARRGYVWPSIRRAMAVRARGVGAA